MLIVAFVTNGLTLLNVSSDVHTIAVGVMTIGSVLLASRRWYWARWRPTGRVASSARPKGSPPDARTGTVASGTAGAGGGCAGVRNRSADRLLLHLARRALRQQPAQPTGTDGAAGDRGGGPDDRDHHPRVRPVRRVGGRSIRSHGGPGHQLARPGGSPPRTVGRPGVRAVQRNHRPPAGPAADCDAGNALDRPRPRAGDQPRQRRGGHGQQPAQFPRLRPRCRDRPGSCSR